MLASLLTIGLLLTGSAAASGSLAPAIQGAPGGYCGFDDRVPPSSTRPVATPSEPGNPGFRPPSADGSPESTAGERSAGAAPPPPLGPVVGPPLTSYDRLEWEIWWRLAQDAFLEVREKVRRRHVLGTVGLSAIARADLPPSARRIETEVLPVLVRTLDEATSDDLLISALMAVGRIGAQDTAGAAGVPVTERERALAQHLAARSQNVSETAALALGILGSPGSLPLLAAVVLDTKEGAQLVRRGSVPARTRAFAAFGLGVMASDARDVAVRQRIALTLIDAVDAPGQPDVAVAAHLALGQCQLSARVTMPPVELRGHPHVEAVLSSGGMARWLMARLAVARPRSAMDSTNERAFCLTALAQHAAGVEGELRADVLEFLRCEASDRGQSSEVRSAAVLALGEAACSAATPADRRALRFLGDLLKSGQPLERRLGALALAQASAALGPGAHSDSLFEATGPAGRRLHQLFMRGGSLERPWGALATGVQAFRIDQLRGPGAAVSAKVLHQRADLLAALAKQRSAASVGAYALGVALAHRGAGEASRSEAGRVVLEVYGRVGEPKAKGYVAVALGLLGHQPAKHALLADLKERTADPVFVWHAAVGLGLIGDVRLAPTLTESMLEARSHTTRSSAAVALGTVGDQRAVEPLLKIATAEGHPTLSRAMAIVALGILCEDSELPWRNPMAQALPFPAMTNTLGGSGNALFDIP